MTSDELVDKLNHFNLVPDVEEGKIVDLLYNVADGTIYGTTKSFLLHDEFDSLGLDPQDLGCVDEHPEGSDRGGWVPTINTSDGEVFYAENAGEWQS